MKRSRQRLKGILCAGVLLILAGGGREAVAQTWLDQDVGAVGPMGDYSVAGGVWSVDGGGADIWGSADGFHFVYQQLTGDGEIVAKVDSVGATNTFAKAGLMMRDGLTAGAAHVVLDLKPGGGTEFMQRATLNGSTSFIAGTSVAAPYWLKLVRSGNQIAGYQSTDGNTWTLVGTADVTGLSSTLDVGLVVCSHDTSTLNTSRFESPAVTPLTSGIPTDYTALTDTVAYARPTPPSNFGGGANTKYTDPTFSSTILRVTDANTRPGFVNKSYHVASNSHLNVWNADSTKFYVTSTDGTVIPYTFNPTTMSAARINPVGTGDGGLILTFNNEPEFSANDPDAIFGVQNTATHVIKKYSFAAGTYSTLLDLNTVDPSIPSGSVVGGMMSGGSPEAVIAFFGGSSQDQHYDLVWFPLATPDSAHWKLLNTLSSTINGVQIGTNLNFHLHSAAIDRSGRYVFLNPTGPELGSPRFASQVYVWDTTTGTVTALTSGDPNKDGGTAMHAAGHDAPGYTYWTNQDCCSTGTYDAAQWQFRSLGNLPATSNLINPVLAPPSYPQVVYMADHESWTNATAANPLVPMFASTYRFSPDATAQRAWDEEIIGIETSHAGTGRKVWRFAHHQSIVQADNGSGPAFWYEPIADVSPNGLWIVFTSNWGKTLGADAGSDPSTIYRQDVFVVKLTPAGGGGSGGGTQNVVWANPVHVAVTGNSIQKTSGCDGCQDAGAASQQSIASGTGAFQFTFATAGTVSPSAYVGIGTTLSQPPQSSDLAYAITFAPAHTCDIRQFGVWKADCTWSETDTFKIAIEADGKVHIYKGTTPMYTSTTSATTYPYFLGAPILVNGVSVNNATITTP